MAPDSSFESRIKAKCLEYPGAWEDHPWDHDVYKVGKKIFCFAGGSVTVKATPDEQSALIQLPNIEVAAYIGRHGWVTVTPKCEVEFELLIELLDRSYRAVAPKAMVKELDTRRP